MLIELLLVRDASRVRKCFIGASGSRKSQKYIFIQHSYYRVVRDTFGVPEVLPEGLSEVLLEVLPEVGSHRNTIYPTYLS